MFEKVMKIIVENSGANISDITMDSRLADDLGVNSLDAVELSMAIKDELDVEIDYDEFKDFVTVGDLFDSVKAHMVSEF